MLCTFSSRIGFIMEQIIFAGVFNYLKKMTCIFCRNIKFIAIKMRPSIILSILSVFISSLTAYYQFLHEKDGLLFVPTKVEAKIDSNKINYPVLVASFINHGTRSVSIFKLGISFVEHTESEDMSCRSKNYSTMTLPWDREYDGKEIYQSVPFVVPPSQVTNKVFTFPLYTLLGEVNETKINNIDICVDVRALTVDGKRIEKIFPISRIIIADGKPQPPSANYTTIEIID